MRAVGVFLAVLALVGCKHTVMATPDQCQQLLEHFIDLKVAEDPAAATMTPKDRAAVRERVTGEIQRDSDVQQVKYECVTEVTAAEYNCAIAATKASRWGDCIE
jgi:hypothetical protein